MKEIEKLLILVEENRHRKDLTPAEMYQFGKRLESLVATPRGRPQKRATCPHFGKGKTRDKVAEALGISGKQYEKIREVHESPYRDLKEELERHGKVDRAHKRLVRRKRADLVGEQVGTQPLQEVICADCLDYLRAIREPFAHAAVFDPPFGVGYRYDGFEDPANPADYWTWFRPRYEEIKRVILPGGPIIFWQAEKYHDHFRGWYGDYQLFYAPKRNCSPYPTKGPLTSATDLIVFQWQIGAPPLLPRSQDWTYDYAVTNLTFGEGLVHPCPRPLDLCELLIRNWTIENGVILDPFTGSGQIPLAVLRVGGARKVVAIEIVPIYAQEAERRLIAAARD